MSVDGGTNPLELAALGRLQIERSSTAERVADSLRDLITGGDLRPGSPLREAQLVRALDVSRNTIREAFCLLGREGLVTHHMHRGVVVKALTEADVRDIYVTRSAIELTAIREAGAASDEQLAAIGQVVDEADSASARADWKTVATLDLLFHRRIVDLLGSTRMNAFFNGILAELRLAFAIVDDQATFLPRFVHWNETLARLLQLRELDACEREMLDYLVEAQTAILQVLADAQPDAR